MGYPWYQTLQRLWDLIVLLRMSRMMVGVGFIEAAITRRAKGTMSLMATRYAFSPRVSAAVFALLGIATLSEIHVNLSQANDIYALTASRFFHQVEQDTRNVGLVKLLEIV